MCRAAPLPLGPISVSRCGPAPVHFFPPHHIVFIKGHSRVSTPPPLFLPGPASFEAEDTEPQYFYSFQFLIQNFRLLFPPLFFLLPTGMGQNANTWLGFCGPPNATYKSF
ncbi:unnamed protein product [Rangifer tarandus platyrhynchus]|uniref:Uncharacterized protein n=1 Tax=Rangifer tarandus platyrhynchus TaxID=3082113 RepID=A0AC59Z5L3_RANTA